MSRFHSQTVARLSSTARVFLARREDAEEVVCDVYLYVWHNASAFDPTRGGVMTWLNVMTRGRSIDRLRKRRDVDIDRDHLQTLVESLVDPASTPDKVLEDSEVGNAVRAALARLSPLRQRLVTLAFFAGISHHEISATVQLPLGTVKSHLRRALLSLRNDLPAVVAQRDAAALTLSRVQSTHRRSSRARSAAGRRCPR